jgi:predicted N-acetyltransferase YhbS
MKIRFADEKDANVLARLNRKFNKTQDTAEQIAARIKAKPLAETALVAEVDGEVVGFACLRVTRSLCYDFALAELTELYVE